MFEANEFFWGAEVSSGGLGLYISVLGLITLVGSGTIIDEGHGR